MSLETGTYISDLVATNPLATDPKSQGDDHIRLLKATVKATFPNVAGAVTPTHTELNYVDGVTSSIQTQLDSKGAIAGQAWTGTHTFVTQMVGDNSTKVATTAYVDGAFGRITGQAWTGSHTFPTQSAGDNSTKVATTAYVDQTAFATALPAQGGEGGKFLTTDGTDASWVNVTNLASAKSSNYTVVAADRYKSFDLTSTATLSLTAAATLGDGFIFYVRNGGTGTWTIDPNSSETIDGATSLTVFPSEGYAIICDGTGFRTFGRDKRWVELASATPTASSSSVAITSIGDYTDLMVTFEGLTTTALAAILFAVGDATPTYGAVGVVTPNINNALSQGGFGVIYIPNSRASCGQWHGVGFATASSSGSASTDTGSGTGNAVATSGAWAMTGGVRAARLSVSSFAGAGTVRVYGR